MERHFTKLQKEKRGVSAAKDDNDSENPDLLNQVVLFSNPNYLFTNFESAIIQEFPRRDSKPKRRLERKQGDDTCMIVFDVYYRPAFSESLLGCGVSSEESMDSIIALSPREHHARGLEALRSAAPHAGGPVHDRSAEERALRPGVTITIITTMIIIINTNTNNTNNVYIYIYIYV